MQAFKIILKVDKVINDYGYEDKSAIRTGTVAFPVEFKHNETIMELNKGDVIYFQDEFARELFIDGEEYLSTNPANLVIKK